MKRDESCFYESLLCSCNRQMFYLNILSFRFPIQQLAYSSFLACSFVGLSVPRLRLPCLPAVAVAVPAVAIEAAAAVAAVAADSNHFAVRAMVVPTPSLVISSLTLALARPIAMPPDLLPAIRKVRKHLFPISLQLCPLCPIFLHLCLCLYLCL